MSKTEQIKQKYDEIICLNNDQFKVIETLNEEIQKSYNTHLKIQNFKRF